MLSAHGFSALLRGHRLALTLQPLRPSTVGIYTRDVPLGMATLQAIERYVRRWHVDEAPLWRGKRGALTRSGVLQVVRRLCRQAGVPQKGVHAFRRAAAAQMKRLGMQDSDILEVCGWKDITMLRR